MSRRYDLLLLDADGTLFDFERAERRALARALTLHGVDCTPQAAALYRQINEALWRAYEAGQLDRETLLATRFRRLFEALGVRGDGVRCNADYLSFLAEGTDLIDGAEETCRALADIAPLYIATNGVTDVQRSRLAHSALRPYISGIFISEEIGFPKPDERFFGAALARLPGARRERTLMVGDSLTSDIKGANNAGLAACWFCPDPARADPAGLRVDWRIARLGELVPIAAVSQGA